MLPRVLRNRKIVHKSMDSRVHIQFHNILSPAILRPIIELVGYWFGIIIHNCLRHQNRRQTVDFRSFEACTLRFYKYVIMVSTRRFYNKMQLPVAVIWIPVPPLPLSTCSCVHNLRGGGQICNYPNEVRGWYRYHVFSICMEVHVSGMLWKWSFLGTQYQWASKVPSQFEGSFCWCTEGRGGRFESRFEIRWSDVMLDKKYLVLPLPKKITLPFYYCPTIFSRFYKIPDINNNTTLVLKHPPGQLAYLNLCYSLFRHI